MTPVEVALDLAANYGVPVFPCGSDKRPRTKHGFKEATTDLEQISAWFEKWPDSLVGVPTGKPSGLFAVDVDPDGASWHLEHAHELGCGRTHQTPRGHHLLYRANGTEIRNSAGKIAPGVDVRGDGGYIIWWPAHDFRATGEIEDIAEPPAWLLQQLTASGRTAPATTSSPNRIPTGKRNQSLTSLAGAMRLAGASPDELGAAHPGTTGELVRVAPGRYEATYLHHAVVDLFRSRKLGVTFRLVTLGDAFGKELARWYRIARHKGRIAAGAGSDLVRDWRTVFGHAPPRLDRIPINALAGIIVAVEVRDVEVDQRQRELTEPNRYSVIDRIVARIQG